MDKSATLFKVEVIGSSPIGSTILIRKSNKAHAGSNPVIRTKIQSGWDLQQIRQIHLKLNLKKCLC